MKNRAWFFVLLTASALSLPRQAEAQNNRRTLIEQARAVNDSISVRLLLAAQDPALGAPDSLWAVAGYQLAAALIRLEQRPLALVWFRWVSRYGEQWPIDRSSFRTSIVEAYDQARTGLQRDPAGDQSLRMSWRWPTRLDLAGRGSFSAVDSVNSVPVTVSASGQPVAAGSLTLQPGTYTFEVAAEGHESRRVTTEILPGVTTAVQVELTPVLTPAARAAVARSVVRLSYSSNQQTLCATGFVAADGLVVTSSALSGRTVDVSTLDRTVLMRNATVLPKDSEQDLAILKLTGQTVPALTTAASASNQQSAWSLYTSSCDDATTARTRINNAGSLRLAPELPVAASGSPLFDRTGNLIGLVTSPSTVVASASIALALERARTPIVVTQPEVTPPVVSGARRKRFPWVWASAGAAAIGLGVALLSGGGDGGPPPTTGGIVITFPN